MLALLGPEFLLGIAAGQMTSAAASVKDFQRNGLSSWTLTHAFYADMGGFLLKVTQGDKEIVFPINSKQLLYLINKGYLEYPQLRRDEIQDKNKADGLARLITIVQAIWFFVNTIARAFQGLAITTLELTTLSFIVVMFATSFYWIHKPLDVATPTTLFCNATIEQIHSEAGLIDEQWAQTPLDFVSRREYSLSKIWAYYSQITRKLHLPLFSRPIKVKPRDRIPSDIWLKPDFRRESFSGVFILAFAITFMTAWNFPFPTSIEQTLWRAASTFNLVFSVFGGGYIMLWEYIIPKMQKSSAPPPSPQILLRQVQEPTRRTVAARLRNISSPLDPELDVPLTLLFPVSLLCALYCVCRMYIFVEDLIGLRSVPTSAFETVEWANYIPHI